MICLPSGYLAFPVSTRKRADNCGGIAVDCSGTLEDLHGDRVGVTQGPYGSCVSIDLSDNVRRNASRPKDTESLIDDADQQKHDNDHDSSACDEPEHPIRHAVPSD